jgi:hypothetical protein
MTGSDRDGAKGAKGDAKGEGAETAMRVASFCRNEFVGGRRWYLVAFGGALEGRWGGIGCRAAFCSGGVAGARRLRTRGRGGGRGRRAGGGGLSFWAHGDPLSKSGVVRLRRVAGSGKARGMWDEVETVRRSGFIALRTGLNHGDTEDTEEEGTGESAKQREGTRGGRRKGLNRK